MGTYPAQAWLTPLGHLLALPAVPSASALAWPTPEAHHRPLQLPLILPEAPSPGRSGRGLSTYQPHTLTLLPGGPLGTGPVFLMVGGSEPVCAAGAHRPRLSGPSPGVWGPWQSSCTSHMPCGAPVPPVPPSLLQAPCLLSLCGQHNWNPTSLKYVYFTYT